MLGVKEPYEIKYYKLVVTGQSIFSNSQKLYLLPTTCICVFLNILTIYSDYVFS
jgi:hypothetical protein